MTTNISAERSAPIEQLTGPMRVALLAMKQGPLFFDADENCYVCGTGEPLPLKIGQRTMQALHQRNLYIADRITGPVRCQLTPHGQHVARTLERLQSEREAIARKVAGIEPETAHV